MWKLPRCRSEAVEAHEKINEIDGSSDPRWKSLRIEEKRLIIELTIAKCAQGGAEAHNLL